ncbi:winged helix-turn-helix domain-containing protein [Candidatus Competibacter phosphatis]|nr:winged helix-turn-helix domain-containing protein [Candidatus Competibacter phosphatis]
MKMKVPVDCDCITKAALNFLTDAQRREICFHLRDKPHYSVEELRDLIERRYDVVYQSKQSYYDILKEAGLSWHRTQATNPKREKGSGVAETRGD